MYGWSLSMAFNGPNTVIEIMHRTVGTPLCVQFRSIDELGMSQNNF